MEIHFTKISSESHGVRVVRTNQTSEAVTLQTRGFLQHDIAHLALELEVPLKRGYWGSVAAGASLKGMDIRGQDIVVAESLAGPMHILVRDEAAMPAYKAVLDRAQPQLSSQNLAERIHERVRRLLGHWRATPFGEEMVIEWPEGD